MAANGNATVEAMASGLAVVAFEYAARQCLMHQESGLLAPFGDSEASTRMMRLRPNARTTAERIGWESVVDEFECVLRGVPQTREAVRAQDVFWSAAAGTRVNASPLTRSRHRHHDL